MSNFEQSPPVQGPAEAETLSSLVRRIVLIALKWPLEKLLNGVETMSSSIFSSVRPLDKMGSSHRSFSCMVSGQIYMLSIFKQI